MELEKVGCAEKSYKKKKKSYFVHKNSILVHKEIAERTFFDANEHYLLFRAEVKGGLNTEMTNGAVIECRGQLLFDYSLEIMYISNFT